MLLNISKGEILSVATDADIFLKAEKYYREGKVIKTEYFYDVEKELQIVVANVAENYSTKYVRVAFSQDGDIAGYYCDCSANTIWRGACVHVTATLLEVFYENSNNVRKTAKSNLSSLFLKAFEKNVFEQLDTELNFNKSFDFAVKVVPSIMVLNSSEVHVSVTVGESRQYVIRNISSFLDSIKSGQTVAYGKDLSFKHSLETFDQRSKKLVEIMQKEKSIHDTITKSISNYGYYSRYASKTNERYLKLTSTFYDLFKLYLGDDIKLSVENEVVGNVCFVDKNPKITFDITQENKTITVSASIIEYEEFHLQGNTYVRIGDQLHRVSRDFAKSVLFLLDSLKRVRFEPIVFEKADIAKFMSVVLPTLRRFDAVSEQSTFDVDFSEIMPKKQLYFDVDSKQVYCLVKFLYGETEINPLLNASEDILRNSIDEYKVMGLLRAYGFKQDKDKLTLKGDDSIYELYTTGLSALKNEAEVFATDEFNKRSVTRMVNKSAGIRISGNLLKLNIDTSGYSTSELLDALASYSQKKKYHKLRDGSFINLEDDNVKEMADFLNSLDVTKKDIKNGTINLEKYRAIYLNSLVEKHEKLDVEKDEQFEKINSDFENYSNMDFVVPESLDETLRDYQKVGFKWLKVLAFYGFGGILADDMGLGKTLQVITLILSDMEKTEKPSIVVAPTSLIYNWENEIKRFAPNIKTVVVAGTPQVRKEIISSSGDANVLITTYDMLKRDLESYEKMKFKYVIADEAQFIKNAATQNAVGVKSLNGEARFAITGTPIENSLSELWSLFDFVMPGYLHSQTKFTKLYESPIVKQDDAERKDALKHQITPFILRRIKSKVLNELPEKIEMNMYADMSDEQKKVYVAALLEARGELSDTLANDEAFAKSRIKILAQLTRLRQLCCHPLLCFEGFSGESGKLELAMQTIFSAIESGHRVLLFSQFTSMLDIIKKRLDKENVSYFYLDGATKSKDRMDMSQAFNGGERELFLISLKAGGTGLNLTGADVVIHYDPWWNPAVMDQASDRAHRFGQQKAVQVINLVTRNSIEEKIITLQKKKKDLVDSVITEGGGIISKMSIDEVRELFM